MTRPCRRCAAPFQPTERDQIKCDYLCPACRSEDNRAYWKRREQAA
jgi:DNA-directed RNA polymerase subunit RPC12/RpoP